MTDSINFRTEKDSMGEFEVPLNAYYGANTMRAILNFPISDLRFQSAFLTIQAFRYMNRPTHILHPLNRS